MITFAHPWFLLALPLTAGPTLLHLLSRRKLRQMEFSSLFFLRRMRERRFRWLKLRDIALLLLRTLFLTAILLALAGPSFQARFPVGRTRADLVIVLDDSYSTSARFDELRNTALRLAGELTPQSRVALITPSGSLWDTSWSDPESAVERLTKTAVSASGRDLESAYKAGLVLLARSKEPDRRLAIVSDGQEHALAFLKDLRVPVDIKLLCFLDKKAPPQNTSILDAALEPQFPLPGEAQTLKVALSRSGKRIDTKIYLKSDDQVIEERVVSLGYAGKEGGVGSDAEPGEWTEKSVGFLIPAEPGILSVSLDEDSIPQDNERFVLAPQKGAVRVALVRKSDSDMLILGLNALGWFDVSEIPEQSAPAYSFANFDLVIWDGAEGLPDKALAVAREGVPQLVLLGREAGQVNESSSSGFETIKSTSFFSPIDYKDLAQVKIFKHAHLERRDAVIAARFSSGAPFILVDTALDVTYVAARFTPAYTDMVYKGLFPVLLQKIIASAEGVGFNRVSYVGDTLSVKLPGPAPVVVETPSVQYELFPLFTSNGYEARFASTTEAGLYKIGPESFVINPDPREASSSKIKDLELKKAGVGVYPLEMSAPKSLTLFLLILAALALALEFILVLV